MKKPHSSVKERDSSSRLLRHLPSVESILNEPDILDMHHHFSHEFLSFITAKNIKNVREKLRKENSTRDMTREDLVEQIVTGIENDLKRADTGTILPVVNATGIILHTGMGRAPLSSYAAKAVQRILKEYSLLEINRETGRRSKRETQLEELLCFLSGAESSTVVNNNAAAVFISLNTVARGKEAIISRGEQIEIGGSFRMPEIMESSGALMKEIGTTNKTKLSDYKKAISPSTGAILVAHSSNFRVMGFTESVPLNQLVQCAHEHALPLIYDLGGGAIYDLREAGLPYEPVVSEAVKLGADIVTFSGDKVMGGPQSGIIVGNKKYIDRIKVNPIARAVRCDKLVLAALEGTLRSYAEGLSGFASLPNMVFMLDPPRKVLKKAEKLTGLIPLSGTKNKHLRITIEESFSEAGSGAMPLEQIPSYAVSIESTNLSPQEITFLLRLNNPPVFGYIKNDRVYLDLRTVFTRQIRFVADAVNKIGNMTHNVQL
ncbi:L-seryl-tRNA(Sec) selenium transferase [candidate division KSB1 bacterium]